MAQWDDIELVSLSEAKQHARLPMTSDEDEDLDLKLRAAHALVLDYIARPADTDWQTEMESWNTSPPNAPRAVQAAILRQFADLVRFRGDDDSDSGADGLDLSPRVKQLLRQYRDPALA